YYMLTGEAAQRRDVARVGLNAAYVRAVAKDRRLFAFSRGATVLRAEGLQFERWEVNGPPLDEWLGRLPRGTLITGATAYTTAPFDLSRIGHAGARPAGHPRAFDAFALIARRPGARWREDDQEASLDVTPAALEASLPALALPLLASADRSGARVDLAGQTIARVDTGRALAVFAPDGTLVRPLELAAEAPLRVPFQEAVYALKG